MTVVVVLFWFLGMVFRFVFGFVLVFVLGRLWGVCVWQAAKRKMRREQKAAGGEW